MRSYGRALLGGLPGLLGALAPSVAGQQPVQGSETFTVEVRAADGQALPGLWLDLVDLEHESALGEPFVLERAPLSPEGRARFPLEALRPAREDSARLGRELRIVARPAETFPGAPEVRVPPALEPDAVLSLAIPRAVAWVWRPLEVRVLDSAGRPAAGVPVHAQVWARADGRWLGSGGGVLTDAVGRAEILPRLHPREPLEAQLPGVLVALPFPEPLWLPWEPGSREPVTLRLPPAASLTVELRADPDGPLDVRSAHLRTAARSGAESPGGSGSARVEGGRVRFPWVARGTPLVLSLWDEGTREMLELPLEPIPPDAPSAERTVSVPRAPREALGPARAVLEEAPVLLTGCVRDAEGKPLSGVGLGAYPDEIAGASGARTWPWTTTSDEAGGFTLRGRSVEPALMLRASLGQVRVELRGLVPGRRDLEVVLPVLAQLEVRLLADEGLERRHLRLRYDGPAGSGGLFWNGWPSSALVPGERRRPPRHDFRASLAVGTYDLELVDGRTFLPLARWRGVTLEAGPEPRLLELDVRGAIRTCRLRLLRPGGTPLEDWLTSRRGELLFPLWPDPEGGLELLAPSVPDTSEQGSLMLELEGHEPLRHVLGVDPEERTFVPAPPRR